MTIDLEPGNQPPSGKLYTLAPDELELLKEYLDEMLKMGKFALVRAVLVPQYFSRSRQMASCE